MKTLTHLLSATNNKIPFWKNNYILWLVAFFAVCGKTETLHAQSAVAPETSESYNLDATGVLMSIPDSDIPFNYNPGHRIWATGGKVLTKNFGINPQIEVATELTDPNGVYQLDVEISSLDLFPEGYISFGIVSIPPSNYIHYIGVEAHEYGYISNTGNKISNNVEEAFGSTYTVGDRVRMRYDASARTLTYYLQKEGESEYTLQGDGHAFEELEPESGEALQFGVSVRCLSACIFEIIDTPEPEIDIQGLSVNFGEIMLDSGYVEQTYTIKNEGDTVLTLSGGSPVSISGADSSDFSVTTQPAAETLDPDDSTSFVIRFDPSNDGSKTAVVTVLSDDSDEGTYTFDIGGKGVRSPATITGDEGWRLLSSPVSGVSIGTLLDTLWTQGFTGADTEIGLSNVYLWDAENGQWEVPSDTDYVPPAGTGFSVYVYGDDDYTLTGDSTGFPKQLDVNATGTTGNVQPDLFYNSSGTPSNDGWNLLGNPYGTSIDWDGTNGWDRTNLDGSFYVWSDSAGGGSGAYLSWNGTTGTLENGKIAPWQGFWVKAHSTSPSISMNDSTKGTGGIFLKKITVPELKLTISDGELTNDAVLMFSDKAELDIDIYDAYKLKSLNENFLSLFTKLDNGTALDINALPLVFEDESIELDLDGNPLGGEYTISWNSIDLPSYLNLVLLDTETGKEIDIKNVSSYSFKVDSKSTTTQKINSQQNRLATPSHKTILPSVLKSKETKNRFVIRIGTNVEVSNELNIDLPTTTELEQNYPNPFNPNTTIAYGVPHSGMVTLEIFDLVGRKVATLLNNEQKSAGRHTVNFDATSLSSGMYLYRLQSGNTVITKKLTLIK